MFAFAACTPSTEEPTDNPGNGGGEKTALATPTLEVKDVTSTGFTVVWEAVENAEKYMVNNGEGNVTITETSYKMENLNAGTYTVKVMAMPAQGANYSNSEFATVSQTVTGLTPEEAEAWVKHLVSLPTEEDAEYGYFPFMHIFHSYKGTGIADIRVGAFDAENYRNTPVASLVAECQSIGAEFVTKANSDGVTMLFKVEAATEYRIIAQAINENGLEVIFDDFITTTESQPHPDMEKWVGTWDATAEEVITFRIVGEGEEAYMEGPIAEEVTTNFEITIEAAPDFGFNAVYVYGLTQLTWDDGSAMPTVGVIDNEGELEVFTGLDMADLGGGYTATWLCYCTTVNGLTPVLGQYPAYFWALNEDSTQITTTGMGAGKLSNDVEFEAYSMEIYAVNYETYQMSILFFEEEDTEASAVAGAITMTRKADAPATASKSALTKSFTATPKFNTSFNVAK